MLINVIFLRFLIIISMQVEIPQDSLSNTRTRLPDNFTIADRKRLTQIEILILEAEDVIRCIEKNGNMNQFRLVLTTMYDSFYQMESIFEKQSAQALYEICKKQINCLTGVSVMLINKLQSNKQIEKLPSAKIRLSRKSSFFGENNLKASENQQLSIMNKLGGIHMYNESYKRGLDNIIQKSREIDSKKEIITKKTIMKPEIDEQEMNFNDLIPEKTNQKIQDSKTEKVSSIFHSQLKELINSFKILQNEAIDFLNSLKGWPQQEFKAESFKNLDFILKMNKQAKFRSIFDKINSKYSKIKSELIQLKQKDEQKLQQINPQIVVEQVKTKERATQTISNSYQLEITKLKKQISNKQKEYHLLYQFKKSNNSQVQLKLYNHKVIGEELELKNKLLASKVQQHEKTIKQMQKKIVSVTNFYEKKLKQQYKMTMQKHSKNKSNEKNQQQKIVKFEQRIDSSQIVSRLKKKNYTSSYKAFNPTMKNIMDSGSSGSMIAERFKKPETTDYIIQTNEKKKLQQKTSINSSIHQFKLFQSKLDICQTDTMQQVISKKKIANNATSHQQIFNKAKKNQSNTVQQSEFEARSMKQRSFADLKSGPSVKSHINQHAVTEMQNNQIEDNEAIPQNQVSHYSIYAQSLNRFQEKDMKSKFNAERASIGTMLDRSQMYKQTQTNGLTPFKPKPSIYKPDRKSMQYAIMQKEMKICNVLSIVINHVKIQVFEGKSQQSSEKESAKNIYNAAKLITNTIAKQPNMSNQTSSNQTLKNIENQNLSSEHTSQKRSKNSSIRSKNKPIITKKSLKQDEPQVFEENPLQICKQNSQNVLKKRSFQQNKQQMSEKNEQIIQNSNTVQIKENQLQSLINAEQGLPNIYTKLQKEKIAIKTQSNQENSILKSKMEQQAIKIAKNCRNIQQFRRKILIVHELKCGKNCPHLAKYLQNFVKYQQSSKKGLSLPIQNINNNVNMEK